MEETIIPLADANATEALGNKIAALCTAKDVVLLRGNLGAGKTTLAKGFIKAFSATEEVTSPTFNLVHYYETPKATIWHFDLYRLKSANELQELGLEDALETAISIIEWPEIALELLPQERLEITLNIKNNQREAVIHAAEAWQKKIKAVLA